MAPRKPDARKRRGQKFKNSRVRVRKQAFARKADAARADAFSKRSRPPPVSESERTAMFESMTYFLSSNDNKWKEQLYRLLQTKQPALFNRLSKGDTISAAEVSDETVRGVSQIIYERNSAPDVNIQVPQPEVGEETKSFNSLHIKKLDPAKYAELCRLCRASVPSLMLDSGQRQIKAGELPDGVQIMVFRYLKKHLEREVQDQIGKSAANEKDMPVAGSADWWEDIIQVEGIDSMSL